MGGFSQGGLCSWCLLFRGFPSLSEKTVQSCRQLYFGGCGAKDRREESFVFHFVSSMCWFISLLFSTLLCYVCYKYNKWNTSLDSTPLTIIEHLFLECASLILFQVKGEVRLCPFIFTSDSWHVLVSFFCTAIIFKGTRTTFGSGSGFTVKTILWAGGQNLGEFASFQFLIESVSNREMRSGEAGQAVPVLAIMGNN